MFSLSPPGKTFLEQLRIVKTEMPPGGEKTGLQNYVGNQLYGATLKTIVAMSYDELQKKAFEEEEAAAAEEAAMQAEAARLIEEEEEREREKRGEGVVKSPSDLSCSSYELFVGQEKGGEEKDSKERGSIRSAEGDSVYEREQKARLNNKMRKDGNAAITDYQT
ncbi:UNVERIFIED_CONTAM: hypothetical protein NCL1_33788 [Trichonephila clavipes]